MAKYHKYVGLMATILVVMGLAANGSLAAPKDKPPTAKVVSKTTKAHIVGARASASDVATGKVVILADMLVKPSVKVSSPSCFWTRGGFWNSGHGQSGSPQS